MIDLATLPAAKLHAAIAKRDATQSALLHETIAAGYGDTRHNEIVALAKSEGWPLLVEYVAACDAWREATAELDARRRYQGNDRPIKPRVFA